MYDHLPHLVRHIVARRCKKLKFLDLNTMMHKPFVYSRKKNYVHASSDDVDDSNDNRNVKMVIWTIIKNDGMINDTIFN